MRHSSVASWVLVFGLMQSARVFANGWDLPELLVGEMPIAERTLPATVRLQNFFVTVSNPVDPGAQAKGGSGGSIVELRVEDRAGRVRTRDLIQAIYIRVQDRGKAPPLFSVWTKTGVSFPVYCRYAYIDRTMAYCAIFCEDYEVGESAATRSARPRRWGECDEAIPQ